MGDADEFGILPGLALLLLLFFSLWGIPFGLLYISTPLSLVVAMRSYRFAAVVAGFGLVLPILYLSTEGLYMRNEQVLNGGMLCAFAAAVLMLVAWILAGTMVGVTARDSAPDLVKALVKPTAVMTAASDYEESAPHGAEGHGHDADDTTHHDHDEKGHQHG
jgi:hypothetical protein